MTQHLRTTFDSPVNRKKTDEGWYDPSWDRPRFTVGKNQNNDDLMPEWEDEAFEENNDNLGENDNMFFQYENEKPKGFRRRPTNVQW